MVIAIVVFTNKRSQAKVSTVYFSRAGRAFLQALRVTGARVLSFPLRVPHSRMLYQSFFSRTKIRDPAYQIL